VVVSRLPILALLALAPQLGCSSDETASAPVGPQGNPTIAITEPQGVGGEPACVEVSDDPDARGPLFVTVDELVLRPPGACIYDQCGHLALYVDGVLNNESSVPVVDVLFRKLADKYHDGSTSSATGEPDVLNVRIDVVDGSGAQLLDHDDVPLSADIALITVPLCP